MNMSKRYWFLGLLTVAGVALLAVGWQGGMNKVNHAVKQANSVSVEKKTDKQTKDDILIKPDTKPSGNAVEVKQENKQENNAKIDDAMTTGSGFFVEYRLERERSRGQQIEIAREIINNADSDHEVRKKAQEQMYQISDVLQKELEVESLIRAKGYRDSVVFLEGKTVTVVIQSRDLNQEDAMKITDLVSRSTQVSPQNIVIIPKY
ncbi:SpoIIIAH-like family protein [Desulforamulus aeronauticus]|uniref:Stage III sporulation protein AH n=1 Tax=Desulforamulus aeronauticus DSM 10349 TaxID=1121421 RepID=A0A1M6PG93_9FIRM|nr:SpoIIIAH-like family protein [Desulforamulus aeronauticus]SHK06912.1 stage III sporulation protein AH [Desulforamulus aeronauticus DSM 10349]